MASPAASLRRDHDTIVVGAGLAGLSAASELERRGRSVLVLERAAQPGGRVRTESWGDADIELGGVFHTAGYPALRELLGELGLSARVAPQPGGFNGAIRRDGAWHTLDLGSPTAALRFSALGLGARLSIVRGGRRALATRPADLGDMTSVAHLDTRSVADAMHPDAAEFYAAGPYELLWGSRPDEISYAMLALQLRVFTGRLLELRGGMGQLVAALVSRLEDGVRCETRVERVEQHADGVSVHVATPGGTEGLRAGAAILALPAREAGAIWPAAPASIGEFLRSVRYARFDSAYLRTSVAVRRRDRRGRPLTMELTSARERGAELLGGVYCADDSVPRGGLAWAVAGPGSGAEQLEDDALAERLQDELERRRPDLRGRIEDRRTVRHALYVPKFLPGYVGRLAAARRALPSGRIDLAGDYLCAPWMEGALRSGQLAAERVDALPASAARAPSRVMTSADRQEG